MRYNFIDLTQMRFGRLLVVRRVEDRRYDSGRKFPQWECLCDCGRHTKILGDSLRAGLTNSCGCLVKELYNPHPTHGMTNTRLFSIWSSMKSRCCSKNNDAYEKYGGRGIKLYKKWLGKKGFQNFHDWAMENGYEENLSIDRIDNEKGYYPKNCRWATAFEQQQNRRDNIVIESNDGITKTLKEWCVMLCEDKKEIRLFYQRAYRRYKKGFSFEELFSPADKIKSSNAKSNKRDA